MNCNICGKPIILVPSAKERAKKFGNAPAFYTNLFQTHSDCATAKREEDTKNLLKRLHNNRNNI